MYDVLEKIRQNPCDIEQMKRETQRIAEKDKVDVVLNDQRRAFSDRYNNEILSAELLKEYF